MHKFFMDIYIHIMQVKKKLYNILAIVSIPTASYKLIATAVCNTIFMQLTDPFHSRMKVSTVITLVVASVGIRMLNANPESIDVTYAYRINATVSRIEYQKYSYDSHIMRLSVLYY